MNNCMKHCIKHLKGFFNLFVYLIVTSLVALVFFPLVGLKYLTRNTSLNRTVSKAVITVGEFWIAVVRVERRITRPMNIKVEVEGSLHRDHWYLVTSNHQSWADISMLQEFFTGRIPFLRFFMKKELIWVPFIGVACWAMDYPIMHRYSRKFLEENPEKVGEDLKTTMATCEKYKNFPVSVLNFIEGTRFTPTKVKKSPYQHLLIPKAGGVAFVLQVMNGLIREWVDVTIIYPDKAPRFWDFMCGDMKEVVMKIRVFEIPEAFHGKDYRLDEVFREEFQKFLNQMWSSKDQLIAEELRLYKQEKSSAKL